MKYARTSSLFLPLASLKPKFPRRGNTNTVLEKDFCLIAEMLTLVYTVSSPLRAFQSWHFTIFVVLRMLCIWARARWAFRRPRVFRTRELRTRVTRMQEEKRSSKMRNKQSDIEWSYHLFLHQIWWPDTNDFSWSCVWSHLDPCRSHHDVFIHCLIYQCNAGRSWWNKMSRYYFQRCGLLAKKAFDRVKY